MTRLMSVGSLGHVLFFAAIASRAATAVFQGHTVVVDAGSSGSRVRVFNHMEASVVEVTPEKGTGVVTKVEPGLSSFAATPQDAGPSLKGLIDVAKMVVPAGEVASTRLWIKATGGMRTVDEDSRITLQEHVEKYMEKSENCPFKFSGFEIISGEEEGLFAWMAVNQVAKNLGNVQKPTAGMIELGGSSMQLTFSPIADITAHKFTLYLGSQRTSLYTYSFQQFGSNSMASRSMAAAIPQGHDPANPVPYPCLNKDYSREEEVEGKSYTFMGTGDAGNCSDLLDGLLGLDVECALPRCTFRGTHIAPIPVDMKFYAINDFPDIAEGLDLIGKDEEKVVTPKAVLEKAKTLCGMTKEQAKESFQNVGWKDLKTLCLSGIYAYKVFNSFGFSDESTSIIFSGTVDRWPLGAMVYETEAMPSVREPRDGPEEVTSSWPAWAWMFIGALSALLVAFLVVLVVRPNTSQRTVGLV